MKYIALLIAFLACSYVGFEIKNNLRCKARYYNALIDFCNNLLVNINYSKNDIIDFISSYISTNYKEFDKTLISYREYLTSLNIERNLNLKLLIGIEDENRKIINEFFKQIGTTDSFNQTNIINNYKSIFETNYKKANEKFEKYGNLIFKSSIIVGLLIIVIFI